MGHLRDNGFDVEIVDAEEMGSVKARFGIPPELQGCHTAVAEGYLIEGHVPADLIRRLLAEKPDVKGLAVPGMPMGSPGMEGPYAERYDVLTFDEAGDASVYASR